MVFGCNAFSAESKTRKKKLKQKKMRLIFKAWILKRVYALLCVLSLSHFSE